MLVATPGMPPVEGRLREFLNRMPRGERALYDIHLGVGDQPTIGFVAPLFGIQADPGASEVIGLVIGIRLVDADLYARLAQPGETEDTAETYLVRLAGANIAYLSPLRDGTGPLKRQLTADTADLGAAYVIENAGGFATKRNYAGEEVLVTGRPIALAPWTLMRTVTTAEALSESQGRLTTMLVVFILIIVVTSIALVAVWRHGSSIRAAASAERFRIAAERFENLGKFLRVVTDGQPSAIVAVDEDGRYSFANTAAAEGTGIGQEDMIGKTVSSVRGPAWARMFDQANRSVFAEHDAILEQGRRVSGVHTIEDEQDRHVVRATHIPLRADRDHPRGVLMILDDVTELMQERERREQIMHQLVTTLVTLVGRADPFSAHQ